MIFDTMKKLAVLLVIVAVTGFLSKILAIIFLFIGVITLICVASTRTSAAPEDTKKRSAVDRLREEVKDTQRRNLQ